MANLGCCVVIPTYNNGGTLLAVVNQVRNLCADVIVVNDGSTDETASLLAGVKGIEVVEYGKNRGKGWALRLGLKRAMKRGFRYAITMDSDGQHFAADIGEFVKRIELVPDTLLIGARNLLQENMPKKNTMGNRISNFWFKFQTGINLPDTQSGYRLYPLNQLKGMRWFTSGYEWELEVMVRAAWRGIPVEAVAVKVFYAEEGKRVSHFRPFADFARITVLNTVLFFPALLWYKPVRFFKSLTRQNAKRFMHRHFLDTKEPVVKKAVAVGFGVFMGIIPIWGYQFVAALVLAHFMKMNKAIVGLAANISVPPMIPFLLYGSLKTGQLVLGKDVHGSIFNSSLTFEVLKQHLVEYLVGSVVFAVIMAVVLGAAAYVFFKIAERRLLKR